MSGRRLSAVLPGHHHRPIGPDGAASNRRPANC
jgi:hypothetical protein